MSAAAVRNTEVLVVGAGFIGLSVALSVREKNPDLDVQVVDASDFAAGGSGRNGAGIRMQWSRDFNIQLSKDSVETFENVEELYAYPGGIDFQQHGYLILAHSGLALNDLKEAVGIQHRYGVPSEILDPEDCRRLQPGLNIDGLHGGAYCSRDGTASPFKWLDALLKANRRRGVPVHFGCRVNSLIQKGGQFVAATDTGIICATKVVLCTDWAVSELLMPFGVQLPIERAQKEAMITEPSCPLLNVAVMASQRGLGVKQLARGNIILTLTRAVSSEGIDVSNDYSQVCAAAAIDILPSLEHVSMLRAWTGFISKTPDMQPVIGETEIPGLFIAVSAYKGFMMSPAIGKIVADLVVSGHSDHIAAQALSPSRFATGQLVPETLTI